MSDTTQYFLEQSRLPRQWYNIMADFPEPMAPVLHPGTHQPVAPSDLAPLFPDTLIAQEMTAERYVDIPAAVLDVYKMWRPSPLIRARRLEKAVDESPYFVEGPLGAVRQSGNRPGRAQRRCRYLLVRT